MGEEHVAVIYEVPPYSVWLSHHEIKKQASVSSVGMPCGAQHHAHEGNLQSNFGMPQAGSFQKKGRRKLCLGHTGMSKSCLVQHECLCSTDAGTQGWDPSLSAPSSDQP